MISKTENIQFVNNEMQIAQCISSFYPLNFYWGFSLSIVFGEESILYHVSVIKDLYF